MRRGDLAFGHAGEVFEQRQLVVVERGRLRRSVRRPSRASSACDVARVRVAVRLKSFVAMP
ncbi:hypothetical protein WJ32_08655 [Burkholderia ubonensis]|nr:hypothetical protein WJ32_08655 [Burkholderia ubonensis]